MINIIEEFKEKKHRECQKNGLVITGRFYQVSINAFYCLMDEFKEFVKDKGDEK